MYNPEYLKVNSNFDRLRVYDTNAYLGGRFGRIYMNRHHKYNILTKSYAEQLDRLVTSMELVGEDIRYMHFLSRDPTTFSRGTDVKTLQYYQEHKDLDSAIEYLNALFTLQINYARNNKPMLTTASGIIENSAIGLVGGAGISCITRDAELVFNETHKRNKLIPHSGSSYYLTRMPGELGTFLALTNTKFSGSEAKELLGLAEFIVSPGEELDEIIRNNFTLTDGMLSPYMKVDEEDGTKDYKDDRRDASIQEKLLFEKKHRKLVDKKFLPPWETEILQKQESADRVDLKYKDFLRENAYSKYLYDTVKLGSNSTGNYMNHYKYVADHLKSIIPKEHVELHGSILRRYEKDINRCFWPDTIDEIIQNLKKENTKFSKYCLDSLENCDKVALNVTLGLLRRAVKSSYSECMHLEMKGMINLLKNEHKVDKNTHMVPELVAEYFKTPDEYKYVNIKLPKHAALPTNKYYNKYADHMRLLMNEHTTSDSGIRNGYDKEVQNQLREQGIDVRDSGLTPQIIRDSIWKREFAGRAQEHANQVEATFLNDEALTENYYKEVAEHIDSLSTGNEPWSDSHQDYYALINDKIYQCFSKAFLQNIKYMKERNKGLHKLKKRDFMLKMNKFFVENRLLKTNNSENFINSLRLMELQNESIHSKVFEDPKYGLDDTIGHPLNSKKNIDYLINLNKCLFEETKLSDKLIVKKRDDKFERYMAQTNNKDPIRDTKYNEWLVKLKNFREEFETQQIQRLQQRLLNHEEASKKTENVQENIDKMLNIVATDQLGNNELSNNIIGKVRNLEDIVNACIRSSNDLKFLLNSPKEGEESSLTKNFKQSFRQLLNRLIQISLLNIVEQSEGTEGLDFLKVDKTDTMEMFDEILSDRVNTKVIRNVIENVKPALVAHLKNVIKDEAIKVLYSLNHQENINNALTHLLLAEKSPHHVKGQMFINEFLQMDEINQDPEIQELLSQRPSNLFEKMGKMNSEVKNEAKKIHKTLSNENPLEALRVISTAQVFYNYDITSGDEEQSKIIHDRISKHFSNLKNPIKELTEYGMILTLANQLVSKYEDQETEGYFANQLLLGTTKGLSGEASELLHPLQESMIKKANKSFTTRKEIAELINSSKNVESLQAIKYGLKNSDENSDLNKVIEYISQNLEYTPNQRRKHITIQDYLANDTKLDLEFINKVADSVLSEKTKSVADKLLLHKEAGVNIQEADLLSDEVKKRISQHLDAQNTRAYERDSQRAYISQKDNDQNINDKIRYDIQRATSMSPTLEHTRNKLENNLIELMITKTDNQNEINDLIQEWIELRTIDMKIKPEYKNLINSSYKNILVDQFKQTIMKEIGLTDADTDLKDYKAFNPLSSRDKGAYSNDIANKHNLNSAMNNALGYDNLVERLQDPENSSNLAQSNYFEKLLAKYYIDKRKDYAASKELLQKLDYEFAKSALGLDSTTPDESSIGYDLQRAIKESEKRGVKLGLNNYHQAMQVHHKEVEIHQEDTLKLIDLSNSTHIAIYGRNNGVAEELLKYDNEHNTWPGKLPKFDIRTSPKQWVENKLDEILKEIFEARSKIETNMSRNELRAFDQHLTHHFNKENMIVKLFDKIDDEYSELLKKRAEYNAKENTEMDKKFKERKHPNIQRDFNKRMQNIDAAYKLIAYRYCREENDKQPPTAFIHFYDKQLQRDIEQPPRPISELDYQTKAEKNDNFYYQVIKKQHMSPEEIEKQYYNDYDKVKEGALEDIERQEAYYILEQYNNRTDLDDRSQQALKDYFSKYENISFFEINKIR